MSGRGETSSSRRKLEGFFCRWGVRGMSFSARRRPGRLRAACQGSTDDAHWLCREGAFGGPLGEAAFHLVSPSFFRVGRREGEGQLTLSTSCRVSGLRWRREQPFSICARGRIGGKPTFSTQKDRCFSPPELPTHLGSQGWREGTPAGLHPK